MIILRMQFRHENLVILKPLQIIYFTNKLLKWIKLSTIESLLLNESDRSGAGQENNEWSKMSIFNLMSSESNKKWA